MASIKPFTCKHCEAKTPHYCNTQIKFKQQQFEHSFGRNYPKESKLVDHGDMPVFLCDECTKLYVKKCYLIPAKLKLIVSGIALSLILLATYAVFFGAVKQVSFCKFLCVIAAPGFLIQLYFEDIRKKEQIDHSTRNLPGASYWGRDQQRHMLYSASSAYNEWLFLGGGAILSILASIFMPAVAFPVYCCILLGIAFILFIVPLFSLLNGLSKRSKSALGQTRHEAIKYFFNMDDGIDLM